MLLYFLEKGRQHVMVAAVKDHTHLTSFVPAALLRSAMRNRTVASCRMYKPNHTSGVWNHISQDAKICLFIKNKFWYFMDTLSARTSNIKGSFHKLVKNRSEPYSFKNRFYKSFIIFIFGVISMCILCIFCKVVHTNFVSSDYQI